MNCGVCDVNLDYVFDRNEYPMCNQYFCDRHMMSCPLCFRLACINEFVVFKPFHDTALICKEHVDTKFENLRHVHPWVDDFIKETLA